MAANPERLRPDQRDRLLTLLDLFTSGAATLRSQMILQGQVIRVADALFDAAYSVDALPALAAEQAANFLRLADTPRTYGVLCRELLLGLPRVEQERAEHAEMQAMARAEGQAEQRQARAKAKAEAEGRQHRVGRPRRETVDSSRTRSANRPANAAEAEARRRSAMERVAA